MTKSRFIIQSNDMYTQFDLAASFIIILHLNRIKKENMSQIRLLFERHVHVIKANKGVIL